MSLINDALKRANQSQNQPARPRPPLAPMKPVESIRRAAVWPSYLVPALLVVVLAMAGWFLHAWWQSSQGQSPPAMATVSPPPQPVVPATKPTATVPAPVAPPVASVVPATTIKVNTNLVVRGNPPTKATEVAVVESAQAAPVAPPIIASTPVQPAVTATEIKTTANPPSVVPATNAVEAVPEKLAAKPVFPEMRLQGIFYRVAKPSVLINSRTLFINDKVEGVKVIAIDRQTVTLEFGGERRVLSLE